MPKRNTHQARTSKGIFTATNDYTCRNVAAMVARDREPLACWPLPVGRSFGVVRNGVWYIKHPNTDRLVRAITVIFSTIRHEHVFDRADAQPYLPCTLFRWYNFLTKSDHECHLGRACLNPLHFISEKKIVITKNVAYSIFNTMLAEPTRILKLPAESTADAQLMRRQLWAHRNNFAQKEPRGREFARDFFFTTVPDGVVIQKRGVLSEEEAKFLDALGITPNQPTVIASEPEGGESMLDMLKKMEAETEEEDTNPPSIYETIYGTSVNPEKKT